MIKCYNMKYLVNIEEKLTRDVIIEADSSEGAERMVEELYFRDKIVLDYSDFESGSQTIMCKGIYAETEECTEFV